MVYSTIIVDQKGKVIHAFLSEDEKWRMKTELSEITPLMKKAFLEKEDQYFYYHPGVNPLAIGRALINNIFRGRKTSGASTITMQVVRMLEPRERTVFSKAIEIFRALQLEWHLSKEEILQLYINLAPYGGNIEGVKSAAQLYFGKAPQQLSLAEVVTLTIIPNRPTSLRIGKNNILVVQERNKWLKRLLEANVFPSSEIEAALNEPLTAKRLKAPREAPHLCRRLVYQHPELDIIPSTVNSAVQEKCRQLGYSYSRRISYLKINNLAIVVINNKTLEVEAYVGSPDFGDTEHSGQVDGITAVRSPGSTLKPMVYAMGFDAGYITPKSIMYDVPTNFDGYMPENFDKKFNGAVSVEEALAYSLNIPAVKMLEQVGVPAFVQKMKKANFKSFGSKEKQLGLSTILGGCGVTLEELSALFSAFAHEGNYRPLRYLKTDEQGKPIRLVSPAAAYMITEILTTITRPDLPHAAESNWHIPKVAWKTGTSYGRRDAWSIGYNNDYTIGVWVGNFNGEGVHSLTGADIATPLLFELFNNLDYNASANWFTKPPTLQYRFVCPVTGKIPGDYCEHTIVDYHIPRISNIEECNHLKQVFISPDEQMSYCPECLPSGGYKKKLYPNLPAELIEFYRSEHISYTEIPEHNPLCQRVYEDHAPRIAAPVNNKEYILNQDKPQEIMLRCNAWNDVKKVYWYINDKFYKEAGAAERVFFTPEEGNIKISCSDDRGRNNNIMIRVKYE